MQKCHFIGIGGIGMSGLARILLKQKISVSGSDIASSYITENLTQAGAKVYIGHSAQHITPDMTIVYSTDINKENPEFQAAALLNCKILHRSDLLIQLMQGYKSLAVTGTHGKTTTTALLASVLREAGWDPSFAVGGVIPHLQLNADKGKGEYFVAEADESDGSFLKYHPYGAIVTNIDTDHMDYFKNEEGLCQAFHQFMLQVTSPDHLFWCGDDICLQRLHPAGISYGVSSSCLLRASQYCQRGWSIHFDVQYQGKTYPDVEVALTGPHNALNALAVFGLCLNLGIAEPVIRKALRDFSGVCRRCENKFEKNGLLFLDDYAHHPTEISTTLKAVRTAIQERRLIAVFQPHRYTRTKDCLGTYKNIFDEADLLYVTDIYSAGEEPIDGLSSEWIMKELHQYAQVPCRYLPRAQLAAEIVKELRPHDVLITLGAGDITRLSSELESRINATPVQKLKIGVIYGGRSLEHDVSLLSAATIIQNLQPDYYDIFHFGITKQGCWVAGEEALHLLQKKQISNPNDGILVPPDVLKRLNQCDVLFPILHGPFGEDGTIQGMFEILGKPYVGCDYRSSALCMDKALTKKVMILNGVPTAAFIDFDFYSWKSHPESILDQIHKQLKLPLFVKPVHLGSTIGVKKVESPEALCNAIEAAFLIDNHVLVENGLDIRELEFAVYGNGTVTTYPPGEVFSAGSIYDYEGKYSNHAMKTTPKTDLPPEIIQEGMALASEAYKAAGCTGMARVDCFLDKSNKILLNEINPIPGFTANSLYPGICRENGLSTSHLMDLLILLGMSRWRHQQRISKAKSAQP